MAPRYDIPEPTHPDEGAPRASRLIPGQLLDDRFEIEARLAAGTMGAVYRARDLETDDPVAIKVQHHSNDEDDRIEREGQALRSINHPGVVRYISHGHTPEGAGYIAMELLFGHSLAERMGSPMPVDAAVELGARIADALAAAHRQGIVHRDIKPANMFLIDGSLERVKLIDFGLTRTAVSLGSTREPEDGRWITPPGTMVGTPEYMSPEQVGGSPHIDARSDVFSLGCVLFECLTGTHPFYAHDVLALLSKIVYQDPPRLRDLVPNAPRALAKLVERMLAKDPAARPSDASEVAVALEQLTALPPASKPPSYMPTGAGLTREELRIVSVIVATGGSAPNVAQHIAALRDIADRFGAELAQLPDGSIVATVTGHGDAKDRASIAARCALAMQRPLGPTSLSLATGRGEVSGSFPVGEAIDRAVLLARAAANERQAPEQPEVRIDGITADLLSERFHVHDDGQAIRLSGESSSPSARHTLLGRETSFVGRAAELSTLRRAFHRCVSERKPRVALVLGDAGIGKSRLGQELLAQLTRTRARRLGHDETGARLEAWAARGDPLRAGAPFRLLAELARSAIGLSHHGEGVFARCQRIRDRVDRCLPWTSAQRVAEFIGELAGTSFSRRGSVQLRAADSDPVVMGDQMRLAFEDWVRGECSLSPVLLLLDDVHWGDQSSVQALESMVHNLSDCPLFIVALARPEVTDVFPDLWRGAEVLRMPLGGLAAREIETLSRNALRDRADKEAVGWIVEHAAGNPLFAEELVRARAEGRGGNPSGAIVAMVQARLESLPRDTRRVLRAASVFGHVFPTDGVSLLVGPQFEASVVADELRALTDIELLLGGEQRMSAWPELRFAHPLVQEAAYATLTESDRALGHRLAATWLHEHGETDAHILATHYERAGDPRAAASWYARSAEQALEGDDVRAVSERVARAIECGADQETIGALRLLEAEVHRWRGETVQAMNRASEALSALPEDDPARHRAAAEMAIAASRLGKRDLIAQVAESLREAVFNDPMTRDLVLAAASVATHLIVLGRAKEAQLLVVRLEMRARRLAEEDLAVRALLSVARAWQAAHRGEPEARLRHTAEAVACLERSGDARNACRERVNLGAAYLEIGQVERAEAEARLAIATATRLGLEGIVALAERYLAVALLALGEYDEAKLRAESARSVFRARGNRRMETATATTLARIMVRQEDFDGADRASLDALETGTAPSDASVARAVRAEVLLRRGQAEGARALAIKALDTLAELGGIDEGEALLRLVRAQTEHACGDDEAAREYILAARNRLIARAETIEDQELKSSFLREVPDHVETLRLAEAWVDEITTP